MKIGDSFRQILEILYANFPMELAFVNLHPNKCAIGMHFSDSKYMLISISYEFKLVKSKQDQLPIEYIEYIYLAV